MLIDWYYDEYYAALFARERATSTGSDASARARSPMHLVIGTVCACVAWDRGVRWRTAAALFVAVLYVGSIYSGWHYAVDGIVGIPLGIGCWWLAGWLTRDGWSSAARNRSTRPSASPHQHCTTCAGAGDFSSLGAGRIGHGRSSIVALGGERRIGETCMARARGIKHLRAPFAWPAGYRSSCHIHRSCRCDLSA